MARIASSLVRPLGERLIVRRPQHLFGEPLPRELHEHDLNASGTGTVHDRQAIRIAVTRMIRSTERSAAEGIARLVERFIRLHSQYRNETDRTPEFEHAWM